LKEFIECNLGINRKLDLRLRKCNENFRRVMKKKENLEAQVTDLKSKIESQELEIYNLKSQNTSLRPKRSMSRGKMDSCKTHNGRKSRFSSRQGSFSNLASRKNSSSTFASRKKGSVYDQVASSMAQ
jgi:chromosome segregation ATPase